MSLRNSASALLYVAPLLAALYIPAAGAAAEDSRNLDKYPDLRGQWNRTFVPRWTIGEERAPLTPEYQKVYEANLADMANGGPGNVPSWYCLPQGMPMMMNAYDPMEVVVTPETTYILISHVNDSYRRIYTDGRDWPAEGEYEQTYAGYSIGKWIDQDADGRYNTLEVETRLFKGPRVYDGSGLLLHRDNQSIVKERLSLDKADRNVLANVITVVDHGLTRPLTVTKKYARDPDPKPLWRTAACAENNSMVRIGNDPYYLFNGQLVPVKKDQPPPDTSYFRKSRN